MSENETLRRMMAEGYSRWRADDGDDNATHLERFYRTTWLCSACGMRHRMETNACPCGANR